MDNQFFAGVNFLHGYLKELMLYIICRGADPNQHILDTLEQCISVIIEKMQHVPDHDKSSSRLSSLDYSRPNEGR